MPISNDYFECEVYDEKNVLIDTANFSRKTKAEYLKEHPTHRILVVEKFKHEQRDSFSDLFGV